MKSSLLKWTLIASLLLVSGGQLIGEGEGADDFENIPDLDEIIAEEAAREEGGTSSEQVAQKPPSEATEPTEAQSGEKTAASEPGEKEAEGGEDSPKARALNEKSEVEEGTVPDVPEGGAAEVKEESSGPVAESEAPADSAEEGGDDLLSEDMAKLEPVAPPPDLPQKIAPPQVETPQPPPVGPRNTITNLEFKMEGLRSRIIVTAAGPLKYQELSNPQVRQFVYLFENTEVPQRLQRAYDTSEFVSPVALFTMLQIPGSVVPQAKLIVQMRESKTPALIPTTNGLSIEFPPSDVRQEPRVVLGEADGKAQIEGNTYAASPDFTGKPIGRLEIKNSDVQDVLRLLAKYSNYNIVIGDDVQGKIGSLSLTNVPWDQAFALVLQSKRLGYVKQGNIIRVATLTSLKQEKEESIANEQSRIRVEPLRTVLIPINYAKAADLSNQAKNLLSERGSIDVDSRTNTIIVKDIDRAVTRVQKLFAALDTPPARVSISAKILEMSSKFSRNLGFNRTSFNSQSGVNLGYASDFKTGGNLITLEAPQFARLLTEFALAEIDGKVRSLANPSVTVMANQQATVNQSISAVVVTNDAVAGGAVIPGVRQVTANLTMDVTPIVSNDGSIFMTLNLKNEIPNFENRQNLSIESRSVATQVLVDSGDTAVIGGIFQDTVNQSRQGLPFLMRIPILGFFFSGDTLSDVKNEIFVFLTAKIMNAESSFRKAL